MADLEHPLLIVIVTGMFCISVWGAFAALDEELQDLGVDMCPEKAYCIQPGTDQHFGKGLPAADCRRLPDFSEEVEAMGVEMCPEKEYVSVGRENHEVVKTSSPGNTELEQSSGGVNLTVSQLTQFTEILKQQQEQVAQITVLIEALNSTVTKLSSMALSQRVLERKNGGQALSQFVSVEGPRPEHVGSSTLELCDDSCGLRDKTLESAGETEPSVRKSKMHATDEVVDPIIGDSPAPYSVVQDGESARSQHGGRTIARYKPAWSDYFHFLSAVKVDSIVSCLHVLPHEGEDGVSRYVAVGDESGQVYLFLAYGDLLLHHKTLSSAPITCMLSYVLRTNETILITGHSDGAVLMHRICETLYRGPSSADDWHELSMEHVHSLSSPPGETLLPSLAVMYGVGKEDGGFSCEAKGARECDIVTNVEMYRVGRMRYILVSDVGGKIQVYRENGSLYGVAHSPSRPLAFLRTPNTQRLLFLTESGAGSLDLRNMTVRSSPCEGLNDTKVIAYTFDAAGRAKAYGFTAGGDLIYVALSGDTFHFKCQVGTKRKLDLGSPMVPHAIKGYLLVSTPQHLYVYNTTSQVGFNYANVRAGGTRPVVTSSVDDIVLSFMNPPVQRVKWPVLAGNRDKLVVVGFGEGYVGIYMSNLPVQKPGDFNARLWSSPIFFSILTMFVAWFYFSRKKDFGLNGNSDLIFEPAPGPPAITNIRGPTVDPRESISDGRREGRRYPSPARGLAPSQSNFGAASSLRDGSLSFRGATADTTSSYSARREPLFSSTNPVGEVRL